MSSGKPPSEGKDLPTILAQHWENFQSWTDLVKKGLSLVILNNLFLFNPISRYDHFSSNNADNSYKVQKIKFQLFQPKQEKSYGSSFSSQILQKTVSFQHFQLFQSSLSWCNYKKGIFTFNKDISYSSSIIF